MVVVAMAFEEHERRARNMDRRHESCAGRTTDECGSPPSLQKSPPPRILPSLLTAVRCAFSGMAFGVANLQAM